MFFTVAQANAILPDVIKKFEMAVAKKSNVTKLQAVTETAMDKSLSEYVEAKGRLNRAIIEFYTAIEKLESTGAMIKNLDQGLLDFPSLHFDEEVWLCWKYGETKIGFWHEKDSGFMGRKPLATDNESLV